MLHGELWVVGWTGAATGTSERLDKVTNRWVPGPDMRHPRCGCGLALFRGQLWAVGGHDDEKNILSSCEYLDTASNTWMTGPPLNHSRCFLGLAVLDGDLWAVGGGGTAEGEAVSERLDAATNVWVAELGLPVFTFSLCCVVKYPKNNTCRDGKKPPLRCGMTPAVTRTS